MEYEFVQSASRRPFDYDQPNSRLSMDANAWNFDPNHNASQISSMLNTGASTTPDSEDQSAKPQAIAAQHGNNNSNTNDIAAEVSINSQLNSDRSITDIHGIDITEDHDTNEVQTKRRHSISDTDALLIEANKKIAKLQSENAALKEENVELKEWSARMKSRNVELKQQLMKASKYRRRSSVAIQNLLEVTQKVGDTIKEQKQKQITSELQSQPQPSPPNKPETREIEIQTDDHIGHEEDDQDNNDNDGPNPNFYQMTEDEKSMEMERIDQEIANAIEEDINFIIQQQISAAIKLFQEEFGGDFGFDDGDDWDNGDVEFGFGLAYDPYETQRELPMDMDIENTGDGTMVAANANGNAGVGVGTGTGTGTGMGLGVGLGAGMDSDAAFLTPQPQKMLGFSSHQFGGNANSLKPPEKKPRHGGQNEKQKQFKQNHNHYLNDYGDTPANEEIKVDDETPPDTLLENQYGDSDHFIELYNEPSFLDDRPHRPDLPGGGLIFDENSFLKVDTTYDSDDPDFTTHKVKYSAMFTNAPIKFVPVNSNDADNHNKNKNQNQNKGYTDHSNDGNENNEDDDNNDIVISDLEERLENLSSRCIGYMERVQELTEMNQVLEINKIRTITEMALSMNESREFIKQLNFENTYLKKSIEQLTAKR